MTRFDRSESVRVDKARNFFFKSRGEMIMNFVGEAEENVYGDKISFPQFGLENPLV